MRWLINSVGLWALLVLMTAKNSGTETTTRSYLRKPSRSSGPTTSLATLRGFSGQSHPLLRQLQFSGRSCVHEGEL